MENVTNKSTVKASASDNVRRAAPTISTSRWAGRSSHPRLVSFSWAALTPANSQR